MGEEKELQMNVYLTASQRDRILSQVLRADGEAHSSVSTKESKCKVHSTKSSMDWERQESQGGETVTRRD